MRVLFEHGVFTAIDTDATADMLAALALGLPAYVIIKVLHPSFFAREDTKTPMIFAAVAMVANVALSFTLFELIGATGIAIAATLSGWINVALLVVALKQRGEFALDEPFRRALLGILLATACMGIAVFAMMRVLDPYFAPSNGIPTQAAALIALVASGLIVYLASAELLGAAKWRRLFKDIRA
jgi:putative peptidoglycan lipid II flippase